PPSPELCSKGDAVRLAADISLPLINTNARMRCDFRNGVASAWLVGWSVALQVLGWFFATLFVVGVSPFHPDLDALARKGCRLQPAMLGVSVPGRGEAPGSRAFDQDRSAPRGFTCCSTVLRFRCHIRP
ncbi:hypothetical protein ACIRG5_47325, partial [Lentzea sp. NPDC102401]|uniref:hypothetical protein n=1 Tax=Lentzea sp. NPDC102401 TaxID=3364128 RepID=UPI0038026FA3